MSILCGHPVVGTLSAAYLQSINKEFGMVFFQPVRFFTIPLKITTIIIKNKIYDNHAAMVRVSL